MTVTFLLSNNKLPASNVFCKIIFQTTTNQKHYLKTSSTTARKQFYKQILSRTINLKWVTLLYTRVINLSNNTKRDKSAIYISIVEPIPQFQKDTFKNKFAFLPL